MRAVIYFKCIIRIFSRYLSISLSLVTIDVATRFHYMFSTCSKECSTKHGNFSLVSAPLSLSPLSDSPIDDRVTASRLRRLRVLLTGRHGNLATSLQWPKVDGLRAGAPEQTEQKSVHARTRNRTCNVRRALSSLSLFLSRCRRAASVPPFFFLSSRRVAFRIAPRITLPRTPERTC